MRSFALRAVATLSLLTVATRGFAADPPRAESAIDSARLERDQEAKDLAKRTHWAYVAPRRPEVPAVAVPSFVATPIDAFVLRKLESEGIAPNPPATKEEELRKVTFDLTGLPPTPAEIDAYRNDDSKDAYSNVVERLLKSPRHAERMAKDWLDVARFGDTHGYHLDNERSIWRYRDWVIDAFAQNMPFDRFTTEQLAGDLLPKPTLDQRIATGFLRCNPTTAEGGLIEEEYLVKYAIDRTETFSTIWLGSTLGCAQCHDHKYDPFTQKEFYQLYAFFNNLAEKGTDENIHNPPPYIKAPTREQEAALADLDGKLTSVRAEEDKDDPLLEAAQTAFEKDWGDRLKAQWKVATPTRLETEGGSTLTAQPDGSILPSGKNPDKDSYIVEFETKERAIHALRVECLKHESCAQNGIGRADNSNFVLTDLKVEAAPLDGSTPFAPIALASAKADFSQPGFPVENAIDGDPTNTGWAIEYKPEARVARFAAKAPFGYEGGTRVRATLVFHSVFARHAMGLFRISTSSEAVPDEVAALFAKSEDARDAQDRTAIRRYFRAATDARYAELDARRKKLEAERAAVEAAIPDTLVAAESSMRRQAYFLNRGQYDRKGDPVEPRTPAILPPLPALADKAGAQPNRLTLAAWVVDPRNPLLARVTMNRLWQRFFGIGLVETVEDFGLRSAPPSHPELLDWLAVEFVESGWDLRHMIRLIVNSSTYRESSHATKDQIERDPKNRLFGRGARFRLDAEEIRDTALFVSGLLVERVGGPSVKPYQPDGIWQAVAYPTSNTSHYTQDKGEALYRRGLYTFWKRTAPPPSLTAFDAPSRERCCVQRSNTNTPLQALALMNDVQYVEASRFLAQRLLKEGGATDDERLAFGYQLTTSLSADAADVAILREVLDAQRIEYRKNGEAAKQLLTVGEKAGDPALDASEEAAWTIVASLLLNLDAAITRG